MTLTPERTVHREAAALALELAATAGDAAGWLLRISPARTSRRPQPDRWSAREIIGHLIDSASNNHGRFVRAALGESMVFPTYDQEAWVALQRYHDADWQALVTRWIWLNDQIASTISCVPDEQLALARREHNLDRIAWQAVAANEPATLGYFIRDYIGHMRHHLAQVAALCEVTERELRGSRCRMGPGE